MHFTTKNYNCLVSHVLTLCRWTSGNHLMNVVSKLCLTASGVKDYDLVAASKCQSNNSAQAWECRDLDLLVLQGRFIHLNWRGDNFGKMVMFTGKGDWSRWIVFETQRNLCTQIYQGMYQNNCFSFHQLLCPRCHYNRSNTLFIHFILFSIFFSF